MTGYESKKKAAQDKLAQPAQEPVAFVNGRGWRSGNLGVIPEKMNQIFEIYQPLYTTPPQPAQEPVAYWNFNSGFSHCMIDQLNEAAKKNPAPLYTIPPQRPWVGLTDEEFQLIYDMGRTPTGMMEMVEAKLKEKNNGT